jgi:hypothetical protein
LTPGLDGAGFDRWIEGVEARRLAFAGGGDRRTSGDKSFAWDERATDANRGALSTSLARNATVVRHEIGALIDAWNAPDDDYTL